MIQLNYYQQEVSGFMRKNFDVIIVVLIIICALLLFCCAILLYMVFLYKNELNQNKKGNILYNNRNDKNDIVNISAPESLDITANANNLKILPALPVTPVIPVTPVTPVTPVIPINILENDSMNDITMYNSCNSKSYNKKFVSINSEDNILSNYASASKRTFDTSSNINDYLSHSYSYNNDKARKHYQYHHRKNNSSIINSSQKRFPSVKKPKPLYERQSSISSTIGSVKSMIKRHYSIRSKNHSRHHSSSNSKIPSILIQNNIPLQFINEELDNKTPSLNEYCQSVNSSITDSNQNQKPKLNYLSSSSNKIKFDEDLPITDVLLPSSSYSYSSKTVLCNNSYENYPYSDVKNEDFINTVNNIELDNMYKENYDSNRIYHMAYNNTNTTNYNSNNSNNSNNKIHEESIYSLSSFSDYSDNFSYVANNIVEEPEEDINESKLINNNFSKNNFEKMNTDSLDISNINIEYKKEE